MSMITDESPPLPAALTIGLKILILCPHSPLFRDRLMVGHRPLKPFILVRIQVPEPHKNPRAIEGFYFARQMGQVLTSHYFYCNGVYIQNDNI